MHIKEVEGSIVIPLQNGNDVILPTQLRYKVDFDYWQLGDGSEEASFLSWAGYDIERYVYRISQEFRDEVLKLSVTQWNPNIC